jgi:hypothetical protein
MGDWGWIRTLASSPEPLTPRIAKLAFDCVKSVAPLAATDYSGERPAPRGLGTAC